MANATIGSDSYRVLRLNDVERLRLSRASWPVGLRPVGL